MQVITSITLSHVSDFSTTNLILGLSKYHSIQKLGRMISMKKINFQVWLQSQTHVNKKRTFFLTYEIKEEIMRNKVHILIASESTQVILGTKVKFLIRFLHLLFFSLQFHSFVFLNVMILKVNFLNFHEHKWNKSDFPNNLFSSSPFQIWIHVY